MNNEILSQTINHSDSISGMSILMIASFIGYLIGSIPFGLVLTKLIMKQDVRDIGSGNIGATNVLRTGNKKLALMTLIFDAGKGGVAVLITKHFFGFEFAAVTGLFAILGHCFPIWLKFKGGKGVATTLGTYIALAPFVGLIACGTWLFTAVITRYSSLSALIAILIAPAAAYFIYKEDVLTATCGFIALLIWFKHRSNIQRLIAGAEPKIGKKKKS